MARGLPIALITLGLGAGAGWFALSKRAPQNTRIESKNPATPAAQIVPSADLAATYDKEIRPVLTKYCFECHGDGTKKGELALDEFPSIASMQEHRDVWKRIRDHLEYRLMPPPDEAQPSDEARKKMLAWIDEAVFPVDPAHPDPGRIAMRRMNREEYRNTIRDLLGVDIAVESILPPDDSGYGFDNIGDVLTLSPVHIERYLSAARQALDLAVHPDPMPRPYRKTKGSDLDGPGYRSDEGHFLWKSGEAVTYPEFYSPGRYKILVTAGGTYGAEEAPKMELRLDDAPLETWEVKNRQEDPAMFVREIRIEKAGKHKIGINFPNDYYDANYPDSTKRDRNLMVNSVAVEGPLDGPLPPKPKTHRQIYGERGEGVSDHDYAYGVISRFTHRAFRRPVKPEEIERYLVFLKVAESQKQPAEYGIRLALETILVSPSFLFREEPVKTGEEADGIVAIDEHALASRLAYFLWSSTPDDLLLDLADAGLLRQNLDEEISRMVASEKSKRFISNFGGQWLQLRNLAATSRDEKRFPNFKGVLATDMRKETELLLEEVMDQNLPAITLLSADFTFLNERLAQYYGIKGVSGQEFRRVPLGDTPRRGILGHGSVLTVTSLPTRTSPVLRGKYVLENLLDISPPPPPPNIPQLSAQNKNGDRLSLREQMERHRNDPACSTCHALMDPIGFGMENFDAVGGFREKENDKPINSSGELADGGKFNGVGELRELLISKHDEDYHRALATKLLTYALGRGLEWYDRPAIDAIVSKTKADGGRFQTLIRAVIDSVPFQYRRASSETAGN